MEPCFGVNVATTWGWSLAECVDAWVRRGVPAIGLGAQIIDAHGRAEGVKLLRDSGLRVSTFTTISPAAMDAGTIESTLDLAADVGADCVYVITGGRKATAWRDAVDIFKEEFGPSRELARERRVRLAIEPMHPLRQDLSFLNTARDAGRVVAEIGDPNVGYVFDFWHLWWTPAILEAIAETAPHIFSVQVSDHKPMTMRSLDRTVPGEGLIPCAALMRALEAAGYDRYYEAEVITDDHREMGYETALDRVVASWERLWAQTTAG